MLLLIVLGIVAAWIVIQVCRWAFWIGIGVLALLAARRATHSTPPSGAPSV